MRLIVPSAKMVPEELQNIGKLPAVVYPVSDGIVFDYLYEQYSKKCNRITVVCYEGAEKVHKILSNYNDSKISIVNLSELSDLGHTIYAGISEDDEDIIINFGDTIVTELVEKLFIDSFYCYDDYKSERWTFFKIEDGELTDVVDKKNTTDNEKGHLFVGVFHLSDAQLFKRLLERVFEDGYDELSTFYRALQLYSHEHKLYAVHTENWFDIGHVDRYNSSALEVKAREFNHISIDKNRGILKKSSDDVDKFIGEIKWYLKLPADVEYIRPRIFGYDVSYSSPYIEMEYYAYHTIHELFLFGDLTKRQWIEIFSRILFVCNDLKRYSLEDSTIQIALEEMYLTKTIQRFNKMRENGRFSIFFNKSITVNGRKYLSLDDVSALLKKVVPAYLYDVKKFNIIHGDLCFANIMIDNNFSFIKVIDPRGKFGRFDIYGDPRYELAKLFHSIDGKYDFIIKDLFSVKYNISSCTIDYSISDRTRDYDLFELFLESFKETIGDDLHKIELIESLLFLSMIPLHNESIRHQMVMLATGLDILNRVVNIQEKDVK